MGSRGVVFGTLLCALGVPLLSPELLGHELRYAHPLHTYYPPRAPLQHLHFTPLQRFHFGHPYIPHGVWPTHYYPPLFLHFGYPIVHERIIIREQKPTLKPHKYGFPRIDFWLLALADGPLYAVTDYWLEDETLHYVRRDGTKSSVALEDVDLTFTKRLNRRLGIPFRLPRP